MKDPATATAEPIDSIAKGGEAISTPIIDADSRILSAHQAMNIVGKDIIPNVGAQDILENSTLTKVGEAYADLGMAIYQWQAEHASEHKIPQEDGTLANSSEKRGADIQAKRDIIDAKIEALVDAHLPALQESLTIKKNTDKTAENAAIAAAKEAATNNLKGLFRKAQTDPKSALRISTENVVRKQVEVRAKSRAAIKPSEKFDFEWFKKDRDAKQDNTPRVNADGSITMDSLRTESDGELLGNAILKEKNFDPNATYTLEAEPFETESGIKFMPVAGTAGFMKKIRENGGKIDVYFGKGTQKLTLASWATDKKYNPTVVKKNRGWWDVPTSTYAVDRNENIAAGQRLGVELVINDAKNLVLADMASGKIDSIDPSNRAMMNFAILTKVDEVITQAKQEADKTFELTEEKSMFHIHGNQPDPAKVLKEKVVHELTTNMSPEEKRQAALVVNTTKGVVVTKGQTLTGQESTLQFNGQLATNDEPKGYLASAKDYIADNASLSYGYIRGRESKMEARTDIINQYNPPSQQAEAVGKAWINFNPDINPDDASPQKIINQQAERIHKNLVATQKIRPLIGELDQNQKQQASKGDEIKDLKERVEKLGGKETLEKIANTERTLEMVKEYDGVKKEWDQLTSDRIPLQERFNNATLASRENETPSKAPELLHNIDSTRKELESHDQKRDEVEVKKKALADEYGAVDGINTITDTSEAIKKLEAECRELRSQHSALLNDNAALQTTQGELDKLSQEGKELERKVKTELGTLNVSENDQVQVEEEARAENSNAREKINIGTDKAPTLNEYTKPKDEKKIPTAPEIAQSITTHAKAAQQENSAIKAKANYALREFNSPADASTAQMTAATDRPSQNQSATATPPKPA